MLQGPGEPWTVAQREAWRPAPKGWWESSLWKGVLPCPLRSTRGGRGCEGIRAPRWRAEPTGCEQMAPTETPAAGGDRSEQSQQETLR